MGNRWRGGAILLAGLGLGAGLLAFAVGDRAGSRAGRVSGAASGEASRAERADGADSASLAFLLQALRDARVGGEHARAPALVARIRSRLHDPATARALAATLRDELVGRVCRSDGEARYVADLARLVRDAPDAGPALALIDALLERGLPEAHDETRPHRHAECEAIGPLLVALADRRRLPASLGPRLLESSWTHGCGTFADFVFRVLRRAPRLPPPTYVSLFETNLDDRTMGLLLRELIRRDQLDAVLDALAERYPEGGEAFVRKFARLEESPGFLDVLETVRRSIFLNERRLGRWLAAANGIYSMWARHHLSRDGVTYPETFLILAERLASRFADADPGEGVALTNGLAGPRVWMDAAVTELPGPDGARERAETILADVACAPSPRGSGAAEFGAVAALACIARDAAAYFEAIEPALRTENPSSRIRGALVGLSVLRERNLVHDPLDADPRAIWIFRRAAAEFEDEYAIRFAVDVACRHHMVSVVPDLRRMLERRSSRGIAKRAAAAHAKLVERVEALAADSAAPAR